MKKSLMVAALVSVLSGGVSAQGYGGVDIGSTKITDLGTKSGLGVYGGYAFNKSMAVELGYRKLGSWKVGLADVDVTTFQLSGLFGAPISDSVSAYARLGMARVKVKASLAVTPYSMGSESESKFLWGLGLDAKFADNISGRVEYQKPASDTGTFSVGLKFSF